MYFFIQQHRDALVAAFIWNSAEVTGDKLNKLSGEQR